MARWDLCWCSISFRCVRERSDRRKVGGLKGLDRLANCKRESEIGRERGSNDSNTNTNKYDQHSSNNKYIERVDQVIMFDNGSDIDWMHHIANQSKMCINTWWSMPAFGNRFTCFHEAKKNTAILMAALYVHIRIFQLAPIAHNKCERTYLCIKSLIWWITITIINI